MPNNAVLGEDGEKGLTEVATGSRRNFLRVGLAFAVRLVAVGIGAISQSLLAPAEPFTAETSTTTKTDYERAKQRYPLPRRE